jgi:hypothetical protein
MHRIAIAQAAIFSLIFRSAANKFRRSSILAFRLCECWQGEARCCLELSEQKVRGFLVLIAHKRLFLEHARKMFGEMSVMT